MRNFVIPFAALLAGFLAGHGFGFPPDLLVLLALIVLTYAGILVAELRPLLRLQHDRPRAASTSPRPPSS